MTAITTPKKLIEIPRSEPGERHEGPYYVSRPFTQEPDWAVTSVNLDLDELLSRATLPAIENSHAS